MKPNAEIQALIRAAFGVDTAEQLKAQKELERLGVKPWEAWEALQEMNREAREASND